jgi:hypothetical protein
LEYAAVLGVLLLYRLVAWIAASAKRGSSVGAATKVGMSET